MTRIQDIPWHRVIAESAIIVTSILLALWVDAWWSNKQERLDEIVLLNALRSEVELFRQFREQEQRQARAIQQSAHKLLEFARKPTEDISDRQIDSWLSDTTWYTYSQGLRLPVTESLVSGGRLGLISNRELRAMILTWPGYASGFVDASKVDLDFVTQQYQPYLRKHTSIAQIFAADDGQPGNEAHVFPLSVGEDDFIPRSHKDLLQKPEFQNLLIERISILHSFHTWYRIDEDLPTFEEGLKLLVAEIEEQSK